MDSTSSDFLKALVELLLENVDEGIHVTDQQGYTLFYNSSAGKIDGISRQEAVGKHVLDLFPSLDDQTSTLLQALKGGDPLQKLQQHISNLHGSAVFLESTTVPLKVRGQILGAVDISRNLTQVKALADQVVDLQSRFTGPGGSIQRERAYYQLEDLIGKAPELLDIKQKALRAAKASSPVLVTGETGTGKEILAQGIHNAGGRKLGPFVSQNCAALPASLMEGILFGTVKGSFTGAENRPGLVELADGGTLLLDEITCLDINLQSKLLRFLQDGFIRRVGDTKLRRVNVRIIASTNINPREAVNQNLLRPDLYYRLNVINITMPALRERTQDILVLARRFVHEFNSAMGGKIQGWSREVEEILLRYPWPGNVRELKAAIESAMHMAEGPYLEVKDLPDHLLEQKPGNLGDGLSIRDFAGLPLPGALARLEAVLIEQAMKNCRGNISQAAKLLGIPRQTLQYKLHKDQVK